MATHYNKTKILFQNKTTDGVSDYFDIQRAYDSTQAQRLMHFALQVVGNLGTAVVSIEMLDALKDEAYTNMNNQVIPNNTWQTDILNNANWYNSGESRPLKIGMFPNLGWRPGKYRIKITGANALTNISVYLIEDKG
jgi:hypothetical protein